MLGKMIKHEFTATGRNFLPMYLFMIVLTPIFSLIIRIGESDVGFSPIIGLFSGISIFGFVCMMIGIFIASYIFVIVRFYRTTATSEAYLTFTLPVSTHQIILSKLLAAIVWQIASGILAVCAILCMTFITGIWTPAQCMDAFISFMQQTFSHSAGTPSVRFFVLLLLTLLTGTITGTLQIYCSIMIGQLFRDHRVIGGIAVYLALYTFTQIVSTLATLPFAIIGMEDSAYANDVSYFTTLFVLSIVLNLVFAAVYYFASSFIMKKHLNVQ